MTPDEFAEKIKTKYPEYKDWDNNELTTKIINKYPQYESQVKIPTEQTFVQDTKQDISETGQAISQTLERGTENRQRIRERVETGEISPEKGTFQTLGRGLQTGFSVLGETALGIGKMLLPQSVEQRIKDTLGKDLQQAFSPQTAENFVQSLEQSDKDIDKKSAERIRGFVERYKTDETFRDDVNATGGWVGATTALISSPVSTTRTAVRTLTPELDTPDAREIETSVAQAIDNVQNAKQSLRTSPEIPKTTLSQKVTEGFLDTAVMGAQKVSQTYRDLVEGATDRTTRVLDRQAIQANANLPIEQVEANIADMYIKAVSPGVKGKRKTIEGMTANQQSANLAVKNIVENRDTLKFRDVETNQIIEGELPTNLWEFGGAITHQKSKVYQEVLASIGKTANQPVDTSRIVDAMTEIIDNPVYKGESSIIKRAQQQLNKYITADYTPAQLEDLIKLENDRLQAYYRGSGTQGDAVVSAIVANNLRDMLDEAVESATGTGVSELKKQYGNLKAIENDVVHRAIHNQQAREAGLVDMFGIRTIGDVTAGLAGDLGALQQGAGQIVGEGFIKALNDRDAMINRMFIVADQAYTKKGNIEGIPKLQEETIQ